MVARQTCVGCGRISPDTHGEITLTTSFGWRIRRNPQLTGEGSTEWRCQACWARFKATLAPPAGEIPISVPPSSSGKDPSKR